jgi:UDP-N-acetylglucosamine 3-dehydrogenase
VRGRVLKGAIVGLQHLHPKGYMTLFGAIPKVEIVCAYDPDADLLKSFCDEFGLKGYTDLDRMIEKQALDLAVIFLPHSDCAEAAIKCARAGLHLMIEKPVADTSEAALRIAEAAAECGVKLTTGYCWRYHPVVRRMKEIVEQGLIGRLVSVEARLSAGRVERYLAGHSAWMLEKSKSGGGPMYNLGVHWLDLIRYVTQETVHEVCAVNTRTSEKYDIEDSSLVLMKFFSGAAGVLTTSYIVPDSFPGGRDLYIGFRGTEGVMSYSPVYQGEQSSGAAPQTEVLDFCLADKTQQLRFEVEPVAGYSGYIGKAYVEGFVEAILQDRDPDIGAGDAIAVLKVVEAVYASAAKKQWIEVCK